MIQQADAERILNKLDLIDSRLSSMEAAQAANAVVSKTQHDRILNLESATRRTIWLVFGGAGTVISTIIAAIALRII